MGTAKLEPNSTNEGLFFIRTGPMKSLTITVVLRVDRVNGHVEKTHFGRDIVNSAGTYGAEKLVTPTVINCISKLRN